IEKYLSGDSITIYDSEEYYPDTTDTPVSLYGKDIEGKNNKNVMHATDHNDKLFGNEGDDRLYGEGGHDYLDGGLDDDKLYGGDGNDVLNYDEGDDKLVGGNGDDFYQILSSKNDDKRAFIDNYAD
ncbi:hypothetical protein ADUPG1_004298, partial [Aduncisulcus paluster]